MRKSFGLVKRFNDITKQITDEQAIERLRNDTTEPGYRKIETDFAEIIRRNLGRESLIWHLKSLGRKSCKGVFKKMRGKRQNCRKKTSRMP